MKVRTERPLPLDAHDRLHHRRRGGGLADLLSRSPSSGVWSNDLVLAVMITNYLLKVGWEAVMTPFTYRIVGFLKRAEHEDYYDRDTDFTPFSLSA